MKIVGWVLVVLGLCAPIVTTELVDANRGSAGYTSATGYLIAIITIVITLVLSRGVTKEDRGRAWLIGGAIVLAACLWSSFRIAQGARIDRDILAARPEINRIMKAAAAQVALMNSAQIDPREVSPEWRPYATDTGVDLSNAEIPLHVRFVELMRRAKARELELARTLHEEMRASGISAALAPDRLLDAQARGESLRGIARYRTFIDSYDRRLEELEVKSQADLRSLRLPRTDEQEMIDGRKRASRDRAPQVHAFLDGERKALDSVAALVKFVDARADSARLADGQVTFADASSQAEYEAMLARLDGPAGSQ